MHYSSKSWKPIRPLQLSLCFLHKHVDHVSESLYLFVSSHISIIPSIELQKQHIQVYTIPDLIGAARKVPAEGTGAS